MKKNLSITFRGLIALMLSLIIVYGTTVSSFPAVTEESVAAQEPVRSAIPGASAPAQATDSEKISAAPADPAQPAAVVEGSLDTLPADDAVLNTDPRPSVSRKSADLAATGAEVKSGTLNQNSTYYIGSDNSSYTLVYSGGWRVYNGSRYYNATSNLFENNGTSFTAGTATGNGVELTYRLGTDTKYLIFNGNQFSTSNNQSFVHVFNGVSAPSYTITFDANGGTGTMANQTITGTANLTANAYTREGYTFTGWNTVDDGSGQSYSDGASITPDESITLYAQWQQDTPPASSNTLYFTNISGWNHLKAYMYNDATGVKNAAFPGVEMLSAGTNRLGEAIYSIEVDPSLYEYIIFSNTDTSGGNTTAHAQTVSIKIEDALANGAGIYCYKTDGSNYAVDDSGHLQVNYYSYGYTPSTGDSNITYKKQIEKLYPNNADDYNYRLHLTMDGSNLSEEKTVPSDPTQTYTGMSGAFIIDVTETMSATWTGAANQQLTKVMHACNALYNGSDSFMTQFLGADTDNQVAAILMRGMNNGAYNSDNQTVLYRDWSRNGQLTNEELHALDNYKMNGAMANYVAALMRAEHLFETATTTNEPYIVFITGNAPGRVMINENTAGGNTYGENEVNSTTRDYIDDFLTRTKIPIYVIGMQTFGTNGQTSNQIANYMGTQSAAVTGKGGYYEISTLEQFESTLINNILPSVTISGDKTSGITITDTLSQYVDFASSANPTATLYTGYNSTDQTWSTTENVSPSVTISGKTVTFSRANEIEGPFKIEIAFNIKTADGVLQNGATYGSSGYPNEGDADTDYTTATSAGKRGYYANSSATISYTLNGTAANGTFIKPVVQAPAETPVQGAYVFTYYDRTHTLRTKTVPVTLNSSEKIGYSGNNNQANVPTFLWTAEAQNIFSTNPLVTAALALEGNAETGGDNWQKDASVYKNDLVWDNLTATTQGSNISYDAENHTVTITATTTPYTFTLMYYTVNGGTTLAGTASGLPYGKAVTFNPIYSGSTQYSYVNYTVPSDGFSYWSADAEGNIPITTNLTYGMIMRGDYTDDNDDDRTVHIYAQYNKTISEAWKPLIEEVKLTRTIDDDHDWVYLDYMTNYLSQAGLVVQEMETKPEYGIVVAKYDSAQTTLTQAKMEQIAGLMIGSGGSSGKSSAYLDSEKTAIAYRFNYDDGEHISDFNRTLYTLKSNTDKAENKKFTAIAYIIVNGQKYYSPINTDIVVIDLIDQT